MKVLVIGRGAREHAIAWKLSCSPEVKVIYCATGNAGVEEIGERVDIRAEDLPALKKFAIEKGVDLVIPGPEVTFIEGITEEFGMAGIPVFGPCRQAFELEVSKAFAKELMCRYKVPTAHFGVFSDQDEAFRYLEENSPPFVIKADGIDAGKGLIIAKDEITARLAVNVILKDKIFGEAGKNIIIEDLVSGKPVSIVAFTDGRRIIGATSVVNYQRAYDQDRGPFTGGMGSFSPDPRVTPDLHRRIEKDFLLPVIRAMEAEGRPLRGVLYMNLIDTDDGLKVVDFQTRFNDPATQVVLPRMKSDFAALMKAIASGDAGDINVEWDERYALSVVLVSGGYPMRYNARKAVLGLEHISDGDDVMVFHARTEHSSEKLVSAGGRVLNVVALADTLAGARDSAYREVQKIHFEDAHYRRDIAEGFVAGREG